MRDMRNPYGSAGGYVRDRRNRDYEGRMSINGGRQERGGRKSGGESPFEVRGTWTKGGYMADYASRDRADYRRDIADYRRERADYRDYADRYDRRRDRADYRDMEDGYADYRDREDDYADYRDYGEEKLNDRELMDFSKRLLEEIDEKDKQMFKLETIEKKSKEMGIKFDKFSMEEFYTVVLMMFTDYSKTLGTTNMDVYLRLAKDWLCDEDTAVQYGEKLAVYYDAVVEGM